MFNKNHRYRYVRSIALLIFCCSVIWFFLHSAKDEPISKSQIDRGRDIPPSVLKGAEKYEKAKLLFDERCKKAGENIVRTAKSVDGILFKERYKLSGEIDQFALDDPYGRNCDGDSCIGLYLFDYRMTPAGSDAGAGFKPYTPRLYQYVDVQKDAEAVRYRYTKAAADAPLVKEVATGSMPRYSVEWEDISTREDREHWIAGGLLKVIDLQTGEIIAERRGYLIDSGQGSRSGSRSPWEWARSYSNACPSVEGHNQYFVSKVLEPK